MEDIKICIVNERAPGLKRQREEITKATPCSKRLKSVVFKCSTPHSASTSKSKCVKQSHVSIPSPTLEQNPEFGDEGDDSLLEPSDTEDESPLYLTLDQIESLLEDDSCFVAEPSGLDKCNFTCIVTPVSEDKEHLGISPFNELDDSNTSTEATLCEENLSNYATMAPSPSHSGIHSLEVQVSKQKSNIVGNVKSSDSVQETNGTSTSPGPVLDKTESLSHQLASDCLANLSVQSLSSFTLDDDVEWNDDSELSFDGDIDNLLAVSPGGSTSEEETVAAPHIQCTEKIRFSASDSTGNSNSSVAQTSDSADSDTADVVQQLYPSIFNLSNILEVHCSPSTVPEPPEDSGSPSMSAVVINETQLNTDAGEDVTPSTSTESDAQSTVGLSDQPVNSSVAQLPSCLQTSTVPVTNSSAAAQERSHNAVTPSLRPGHRSFINSVPESDKDNYYDWVSMHIEGPERENYLQNPLSELTSLLNQVNRENVNWQHPSNLSRRHHPRHGSKPSRSFTLDEWVKKGGSKKRFMNIPTRFQRNPIPKFYFSSSPEM